jgi:biotin carboxyl carrier protein
MKYDVLFNGARRNIEFTPTDDESSPMTAILDGRMIAADVAKITSGVYSILFGGRSIEAIVEESAEGYLAHVAGSEFLIKIIDPRSWRGRTGGGIALEGRQEVVAPMPGKIVSVLVAAGQNVEANQGLLVIEAMKMQNEIRSPKTGAIERLLVKEGRTVSAGEILAIVT